MAANQIVLDSGAVSAFAEKTQSIRRALKKALTADASISIPTVVLVECLTGSGPRDARVHALVKLCSVIGLDERIARRAASLRFAHPSFGVIDAVVVATADGLGGATIVTGDERDLRSLSAMRGLSQVVTL